VTVTAVEMTCQMHYKVLLVVVILTA